MYEKKKDQTISFRTSKDVNSKIEELADRIKDNRYEFGWSSPMRDAASKSGLIHQVLMENLTFQEIREKLIDVEEVQDEIKQ